MKKAAETGDMSQLTIRNADLRVRKPEFEPEDIRELRKQLGLSQTLFARFLGADPKTVQAWEQGISNPAGIASRWLDEIQGDLEYWLARIRESATRKRPSK